MKKSVAAGLLLLLATACQTESTSNPKTTAMSTDIQELSKYMQLPAAPKSVKWIRSSPQVRGPIGPNDFTLVALLDFTPEDAARIRAKSDAPPDNEPFSLRTDTELQHFFTAAESANWERPSKNFIVVPGKTFGPSAFAKSPFLHGKAAVLDSNPGRILVALYTS